MNSYQPVVVYTGSNLEAFEAFLSETGLHKTRFLYASSWVDVAVTLHKNPCAVVVAEFHNGNDHLVQVLGDFPNVIAVGITDFPNLAENLAENGFFDIIMGSDPAWRLLNSIRNAVKLSTLVEFWNCMECGMS